MIRIVDHEVASRWTDPSRRELSPEQLLLGTRAPGTSGQRRLALWAGRRSTAARPTPTRGGARRRRRARASARAGPLPVAVRGPRPACTVDSHHGERSTGRWSTRTPPPGCLSLAPDDDRALAVDARPARGRTTPREVRWTDPEAASGATRTLHRLPVSQEQRTLRV